MHPASTNLLWKPTPPSGMRSSMHLLSLPARATVCLMQAQGWQNSSVPWWDHRSCEQTERSSHHTPLSWLSCSRKVLHVQDICKACCQLLVKALIFPDVSYRFLLVSIDNALGWITDILKWIRLFCVSVSPVPFLLPHHRIYGFEMLIHIHYSFWDLKGTAKGRAQINKNVKAAMKAGSWL